MGEVGSGTRAVRGRLSGYGSVLALAVAGIMIIGRSDRTAARIPNATRFPRDRRHRRCSGRIDSSGRDEAG
jgi:hypothetical protein